MAQTLPNTNELLKELHALGLLSPEQAARFAIAEDASESPRECAARLIEAGLLTWYQAEQILAGKGRRLTLGPYVLLEPLGHGGMGHVYKAEHRLMKRVVALKLVGRLRDNHDDSTLLRRFRREVEAAGRLRHPSIVTAYDAGEARGRLYLTMEYIEGIDLERLVSESGPLSADLACEIVRQTAEALHHTHECGLIHRDIKPSNLMLAPPGVTVKLLDLGLATGMDTSSFREEADDEDATDEELCGTPDFMAPEYAREGRRTDVRGDLYSLGCTFYFLLTGQVPYPGGNGTEKLLRHSLDAPLSVRDLQPDVPADVAVIVERLMARELEDRYPTAATVAADVSALRFDASEPEKIVPQPPRSPKATRFSRVAIAAVLLGIMAAGGARWLAKRPSPSTASPEVPEVIVPPFHIEGKAADFTSLAQVIAAARDGDTVTVRGSGPFRSPPLNLQGKALTVRAAEGVRPRLEMKPGADPWQALFKTDQPLTLEGLDLAVAAPQARGSHGGSLICCAGASVQLIDCRMTTPPDSVAIIARNVREILVDRCRIDAGSVGLSVEVGRNPTCRLRVQDSRLTVRESSGAALSLWAPEVSHPTAVHVQLHGNTLHAGRIASVQALPAGLTIQANNNRFTFGTALLHFSGCPDREACRRNLAWREADNAYDGPASCLWINGQPVSLTERAAQ